MGGVGSGIGLFAVGAILAFATHFHISAIDVQMVGWILMAVGVVRAWFGLAVMRRRAALVEVAEEEPVVVRPDPDVPVQPHVLGDHIIAAHPEVTRGLAPLQPEEEPVLVEEEPVYVEEQVVRRDPQEAPPLHSRTGGATAEGQTAPHVMRPDA
jgi:hypothetical protein